ncbi:MAG: hypothetical protein AAF548_17685 [Actinomycetota bacterium]
MTRRLATLLALLLLAASCGDDGGDETAAAPTTETPTTTEAPTTTTEAPPTTTEAPTTTTTESPALEPHPDQSWTAPVNGIELDGDTIWAASLTANEIVRFDAADGTIYDRVATDAAGPDDVTVGPDGLVYWTSFFDGPIGRTNGETSEEFSMVGETANGIAFTDDGRLLVSQAIRADGFFEVPLDGGDPVQLAASTGDMNAFAVVGDTVLGPTGGIAGPGAITAIDLTTGEITAVVGDLPALVASALGPDDVLYVLTASGEVYAHTLGSETADLTTTLPTDFYDNLDVADDGTIYASSFASPVLVVVAPDGSQSTVTIGAG